MMLTIAEREAVATPASAPARTEFDRQAPQKPAQNRIPAPTNVDVVARAWKSTAGTSQSKAVRPTNKPPNSAAHSRLSRHASPAI